MAAECAATRRNGQRVAVIELLAGHEEFSTTEIYIREAEVLREGSGQVFPALPQTLLNPNRPNGLAWIGPHTRYRSGITAEREGFEPSVGF